MHSKTAYRFAETSLALYASEGTFVTGVAFEDDVEEVARAFERLGCIVERQPLRRSVRVTPPKDEAS